MSDDDTVWYLWISARCVTVLSEFWPRSLVLPSVWFFYASCHSLVEIHSVASFWSQHISEHCSPLNIIVFTLSSAASSLKCRALCKCNRRPGIASNNTYSSLPGIKTRWNERPCTYTLQAYGLHQYWNDYKKLSHRKRGRMPAQWLLQFSAAPLFSGSESGASWH